jgi:hypothetical protein
MLVENLGKYAGRLKRLKAEKELCEVVQDSRDILKEMARVTAVGAERVGKLMNEANECHPQRKSNGRVTAVGAERVGIATI